MRAALLLAVAAVLAAAPAGAAVSAGPPAAGPGGAVVMAPQAVDPAEPDPDVLPLTVAVESLTPVLEPGQDLALRIRVTNTGTEAVSTPRLLVRLDRDPFISRSQLDTWRTADPLDAAGRTVLTTDLTGPLPPGGTVAVDTTVPAASIGLSSRASWGPRGLAAEIVDRDDPARERIGLVRTFLLWFPEQEVSPTRLSMIVPVVGPSVDPHAEVTESLDQLVRPSGRLGAVLAATGGHTDVTWAVDPWLVERALDDGTAPARAWAQGVVAATTGRDVVLLPAGDADVAALAHAGADAALGTAVEEAERSGDEAGLPGGIQLVLPANDLPDLAEAAVAGRVPFQALVVGPGELPASDVLTYTPTGRATVSTAAGDTTVLVADRDLSAALRTGAVGIGPVEPDAPSRPDRQLTPATASQDLIAELAVITRERPSDGRHLLITVPRDWHPDPATVRAQLSALEAAPWVRMDPVAALIGAAEDEAAERGTLPRTDVDPQEITAGELDQLRGTLEDRSALVEMVEDPTDLLGDLTTELVAPLSLAWREDPAGRSELLAASAARTAVLRDAVAVLPGSDVNLISRSGGLPVQVANALDQPVTVVVRLRPGATSLIAEEPVTITVPAQGEAAALIAVRGVQTADVPVLVEVSTPTGTIVDATTVLTVHVRAEWEDIGTAVVGGLLAIGLVIGLVRTIRRGRGARRAAPVASGPDALSPEEAEELAALESPEHAGSPTPPVAHSAPGAAP